MARIIVSILNYGQKKLTLACLASLYQANLADSDELGVVLVDNSPTNETIRAVTKQYPQVVVFHRPENLGFVGGNNLAAEYAVKVKQIIYYC